MEGKRKKYCKFPGCNNAYLIEVHRRWKEICSMKESTGSSNFVICEDHFRNTDFVNENKHRLKPGTVSFVQCSDIAENLSWTFEHSVDFKHCLPLLKSR